MTETRARLSPQLEACRNHVDRDRAARLASPAAVSARAALVAIELGDWARAVYLLAVAQAEAEARR